MVIHLPLERRTRTSLMTRVTWEHECAEERGIIPGYPFKSLQFLSKGLPGEKMPR